MVKRVLAALMSVLMIFTACPVTVVAEQVLYVYPEVNAYLSSNDQMALEMEFREWARELIYNYFYATYREHELGQGTGAPFSEYYRLAKTKSKFDVENTGNDHVIYNVARNDENQENSLYMWVLLESLKEAVNINYQAIINQYENMPKSERKYMMLNIEEGGLAVDSIVINAQEQSQDITNAAWLNVGSDLAMLVVDTVAQYHIAMKPGESAETLSALSAMLTDAIDEALETIIEGGKTNALLEAKNVVRDELCNQLATQIVNVSDQAVLFLANTYGADQPWMNGEEYEDLIEEFIRVTDLTRNDKLGPIIGDQALAVVNSNDLAASMMNTIGYEALEVLDPTSIAVLGALDGIQEALKQFIDYTCDQVEEKLGKTNLEIPLLKGGKLTLSPSIVISSLSASLTEAISNGVNSTIDQYYESYMNGNPIDTSVISLVGDSIGKEFTSGKWVRSFGNKLIAVISAEVASDLVSSYAHADNLIVEIVGEGVKSALDENDTALNLQAGTQNTADSLMSKLGKLALGKTKGEQANLAELKNKSAKNLEAKIAQTEASVNNSRFKNKSAQYSEKQRLKDLKQQKEKIDMQQQIVEDTALISIVTSVWDKAWETGGSIRAALDSTVASCNGEGRMSLLAARVYSAYDMSNPLGLANHNSVLSFIPLWNKDEAYDVICDPQIVPLETLVQLVSGIHTQLKYDIVGAKSYYDISFHIYVGNEFSGLKLWRDEKKGITYRAFMTDFYEYVGNNHINVMGGYGIVSDYFAQTYYDKIVVFEKLYFDTEWNEEWIGFFE